MDSDSDDDSQGKPVKKLSTKSAGKPKRSLTPAQRKISVQKERRDRTASRREGNEP